MRSGYPDASTQFQRVNKEPGSKAGIVGGRASRIQSVLAFVWGLYLLCLGSKVDTEGQSRAAGPALTHKES